MPGPTLFEIARSLDNELKGNFRWPGKTVTAAGVTVLNGNFDAVVDSDATLGAQNIQLPDATLNKGMPFFLKKVDATANQVVISCAVGGQNIDGVGSFVFASQNDFLIVVSNGVGYSIYSKLITPIGPGASVYTVKKIYKTNGVSTLNPVDGTTLAFNVAVDGECFFAATGVFAGLSGLIATDLAIYVDGVLLVHSDFFAINGSGGDRTGPVTQEPNGSIFLAAGLHTVNLVAGQVNIALQASVADPLTLTVVFPGAITTTTTMLPEAARVRTSAPVTINPAVVISFGTVDANSGNLFNPVTPTKMIAQTGGWYQFVAQLLTDVGIDGSFRSLKLRKNGTLIVGQDQRDDFVHNNTQRGLCAETGAILLNPGDFIEVIAETDATDSGNVAIDADDYSIVFAGIRIIPASSIGVAYGLVAFSSAPNATSAAGVTIAIDTKLVETPTGAFAIAAGAITVPVTGLWDVDFSAIFNADAGGTIRTVNFFVNGVNVYNIDTFSGDLTTAPINVQGPTLLQLNAGDLLSFQGVTDSGGNPTIQAGAIVSMHLVK